jgi:FADH2 O2-dependent halogenase
MPEHFDLAILGSGFAGSLTALIARRLGRSVALIERTRHPRFAIGESSTPLANLLLEELATRYDLPRLLPLAKWGTWQQTYPHIACGLKRGFTFYHHRPGEPFDPRPDHANQLLVAASPNDYLGDTHWFRADVDHFLVTEAIATGVTYLDETRIESLATDQRGATLSLHRQGGHRLRLHARLLIDATGGADPTLWSHLGISRLPIQSLPTQTLFSHFRHVADCSRFAGDPIGGAPYPPDLAAVHHVLADGGWLWSLRFNNGITSAGIIATDSVATELNLSEGAPAWPRLLNRYPSLANVFADAEPTRPFTYAAQVSFRASRITGPSCVLLPSAAGFVDPLLSTGFPLTLLGLQRLAHTLAHDWAEPRFEAYASSATAELDATALLVSALYRAMPDSARFSALTLLYFAAASFSEIARRLARAHLAPSFLLHDHPTFGPALRACCGNPNVSTSEILAAIAPIDVAGLSRPDRRNWYPVDPRDTLAAHHKLGVDPPAIHAMFLRCGISSDSPVAHPPPSVPPPV